MHRFAVALAVLLGCASCQETTPPAAQASKGDGSVCSDLPAIKVLPFRKEDRGRDPVYNGVMREGAGANACLIERISDTTAMADPRNTPNRSPEFRVGDLAFMLYARVNNVGISEFLPGDEQERFKHEGTDAYFRWVNQPGNRARLQTAVRRRNGAHPTMPSVVGR